MKVVTGQCMAEIDRVAIVERGVPSLSLMERAGCAVAQECHRLCGDPTTPVLVLCGRGNNGGDGWVTARHLFGWGYRPRVLVTHPPEELSPDSQINWKRYTACPYAVWQVWDPSHESDWFAGQPVVVDALLGTGISGKPRSPYLELLDLANRNARWILGVDVSSGVNADTGEVIEDTAATCRATVTFGLPKMGHFLLDGLDRTGSLSVVDIGFPKDLTAGAKAQAELITRDWVCKNLPRYPISAHKGLRGKVLLVAGSQRLLGAAILSARAALAAGSGLVTLALPESLNAVVKGAVPEVMTLPLPETETGGLALKGLEAALEFSVGMDACAIGPGLGGNAETAELVVEFLRLCDRPVVVDADGLNALGTDERKSVLRGRAAPTILTPHPGEMARIARLEGPAVVEARRWEVASESATDLGVTLLLKGAATVVATEGCPLFLNRTGHPAMAQGGVGDALTGIVVALVGQRVESHTAAALAAFLHGRAGERAAEQEGPLSVTAGRLIENLGKVIRDLHLSGHQHTTAANG